MKIQYRVGSDKATALFHHCAEHQSVPRLVCALPGNAQTQSPGRVREIRQCPGRNLQRVELLIHLSVQKLGSLLRMIIRQVATLAPPLLYLEARVARRLFPKVAFCAHEFVGRMGPMPALRIAAWISSSLNSASRRHSTLTSMALP